MKEIVLSGRLFSKWLWIVFCHLFCRPLVLLGSQKIFLVIQPEKKIKMLQEQSDFHAKIAHDFPSTKI